MAVITHVRRAITIAAATLLIVVRTSAQAPPSSIQIFLPGGGMPSHPIQLQVMRTDGFSETAFTDSKGVYMFRTPTTQAITYTVTISGDRGSYDTTIVTFTIERNSPARMTVFLKAPAAERKPTGGKAIIDAANFDASVPAKARDAYKKAMKLVAGGDLQQAIAVFQEAIAIFPQYVRAMNDLGVTFMKLNRLEEADASLRTAIDLDKRFFHARLNLGIVLNRQGKYKEALDYLEPLYEENKGMLELRLAYGQALGGADKLAEAESLYKSTLESQNLEPQVRANLYFRLGVVLNREGRFRDAETALRSALRLDPDAANSHVQLGAALMQLEDAEGAERELLRGYALAGSRVGIAQLLLGQIYYAEKKFTLAQQAFEQYLKDIPNAANREQISKLLLDMRSPKN